MGSNFCCYNYCNYCEKGEFLTQSIINSFNLFDNQSNYRYNILSSSKNDKENNKYYNIDINYDNNYINNTDNNYNRNNINISIEDYDLNDSNNNILNIYNEEINENERNSEIDSRILENIDKLSPEKRRCTICLENFKNFDKIINLTCLHMFHDECIRKWLNENNYCPICKTET